MIMNAEYLAKRTELLKMEKELTKRKDELAALRRALPRVKIDDQKYVFDTATGPKSLSQLFNDKSQLVVQHFMYDDDAAAKPCNSCSFWVDTLNGPGSMHHLRQRNAEYVVVAKADIDALLKLRADRHWNFTTFVSSRRSTFNADFGVEFDHQEASEDGLVDYNFKRQKFPAKQAPGFSFFYKDPQTGDVYLTYNCFARGVDVFNSTYQLLDHLPLGRNEQDLPYTMAWLKPWTDYDEKVFSEPLSPVTMEIHSSNATEHIDWLTKAFQAKVCGEVYKDEKTGLIFHSVIKILGGFVFVADATTEPMINTTVDNHANKDEEEEKQDTSGAATRSDAIMIMHSYVETLYEQAIEQGATVKIAIHDAFWGARYALIVDPFGVKWALHGDLRDKNSTQETDEKKEETI